MGIRGVPASHGGFETFAERLAPYLLAAGWRVTVYCQEEDTQPLRESHWNGVRRIHIGVGPDTAASTVRFDWACISHAIRERPSMVLTLGYNTAAFGLRLRAAGIPNVTNMDGIEWSRDKWGPIARAWLYLNERLACIGSTHLVADHPRIASHLATRVSARKITTIPYGAEPIAANTDGALLGSLYLEPHRFATVIARPEPENSILEIVQAFSAKPRGIELIVLGNYKPQSNVYHARVMSAASAEVRFAGAIYDQAIVQALRVNGLFYLHGHRVGGTNPSLLEAMSAGHPIIAHDNPFNRWVAGESAAYFSDVAACTQHIERLLRNPQERQRMGQAALARVKQTFAWDEVLHAYAALLTDVHCWYHGRPSWPRLLAPQPHEGELRP